MRALLQRVREARVEVESQIVGQIQNGLLLFLGIQIQDTAADADYLIAKVLNLRIFPDVTGKMNRSVIDTIGGVLIVSQFTLYGDCRKGRRPSFEQAAAPESARLLYDYFVSRTRACHGNVATGLFQAAMQVYLVNDGPVTLLCESVRRSDAITAEAKIKG